MNIAPVLRWPGSKWTLAQWIIDQMPPHVHYLEPFFGSGAVLFSKQPSTVEAINDISGDVVNLFRVIRDQPEEIAKLVDFTLWSRDEYYISHEKSGNSIEDARKFLVRCWQGNMASTDHITGWDRRIKLTGGLKIKLWPQVPERILKLAERLKGTYIENKPALQVINDFALPDVLIYADPPYLMGSRPGGKMYAHEMTDADHAELLEVLDAHPGPVILSGYACPLYDDRLKHWTRLTHDATAERGKKRTEVLWMNPECVRRQGRLFD